MAISVLMNTRSARAGGVAETISLMLRANQAKRGICKVLNRLGVCQSQDSTNRKCKEQAKKVEADQRDCCSKTRYAVSFDNLDGEYRHTDRVDAHNTQFHYTHAFARPLNHVKDYLDSTKITGPLMLGLHTSARRLDG